MPLPQAAGTDEDVPHTTLATAKKLQASSANVLSTVSEATSADSDAAASDALCTPATPSSSPVLASAPALLVSSGWFWDRGLVSVLVCACLFGSSRFVRLGF
jgi:hypothetical protein